MPTHCLSLLSVMLTATLSRAEPAPKPDPVVTEKSLETFAVDLDGLALHLPLELKDRATPKKMSDKQTDLSIGNLDFSYRIGSGETSTLVSGWAEFEGGKFSCDASKIIGSILNTVKSDDRTEHRVQRIANNGFNGYLMTTAYYSQGAMDGADVTLIDTSGGSCYNVNLALDFAGFNAWQIKKAISPIMDAATKSFVAFAKRKGGEP